MTISSDAPVCGDAVGGADEEGSQQGPVGPEVVGVGSAPQQGCGPLVGARRATQSEADPTGVQAGQRAELLRDGQRRVVGKHHATGAFPALPRAGSWR